MKYKMQYSTFTWAIGLLNLVQPCHTLKIFLTNALWLSLSGTCIYRCIYLHIMPCQVPFPNSQATINNNCFCWLSSCWIKLMANSHCSDCNMFNWWFHNRETASLTFTANHSHSLHNITKFSTLWLVTITLNENEHPKFGARPDKYRVLGEYKYRGDYLPVYGNALPGEGKKRLGEQWIYQISP